MSTTLLPGVDLEKSVMMTADQGQLLSLLGRNSTSKFRFVDQLTVDRNDRRFQSEDHNNTVAPTFLQMNSDRAIADHNVIVIKDIRVLIG